MDNKEVKNYVSFSKALEIEKEALKKKKEEFETSISNYVKSIDNLTLKLNESKTKLSKEALEEYALNQEKKLFCGIGIREIKKVSYNEKKAMDWAVANNMCLQLDKKKFEKVAPELVDFITTTKVLSVTFPKVLILKEDL